MSAHIKERAFFAKELTELGLKVFPVWGVSDSGSCSCGNPSCSSIGKHPTASGWQQTATADIEEAFNIWFDDSKANIGVLTGGHGGVVVLDVDDRHGGTASLAKLEAEHGPLPETWTVTTGNGRHVYFQGNGTPVRNGAALLPGLDIRGEGGFVVGPGSRHANGSLYNWAVDPRKVTLSPLPAFILGLTKREKAPEPTKATEGEKIPEGNRNAALTSLAGTLRERGLSAREIEAALLVANRERCTSPLPDSEVRTIAASVARYEPGEEKRENRKRKLQGKVMAFHESDPWPDPVDGAALLDEIAGTLRRYVVMPPEAHDAVALWVLHSHAHPLSEVSPVLVLSSPTRECGKTTLLGLIGAMVPRAFPTSNCSPAAVYRSIEEYSPTLLIDEADTFFEGNEDLRGLINAGHRRESAYVSRTVGEDHEVRLFRVWCPKVVALIGTLHETITSRAIVLPMRRKTKAEKVERQRIKHLKDHRHLNAKAVRWVADNHEAIGSTEPRLPDQLSDRGTDNWEPLVAIADVAGGDWPERARSAALTLGAVPIEPDTKARVLPDLKALFDEKATDFILTMEIIEGLAAMDEAPWRGWNHGKGLTANAVANLLKPYGVKSAKSRDNAARGYYLKDLAESFGRYVPENTTDSSKLPTDGLFAQVVPSQPLSYQGLDNLDNPDSPTETIADSAPEGQEGGSFELPF